MADHSDATLNIAPHLAPRQRLDLQFDQMLATRQPMMPSWKDMARFIDPFSLDGLSNASRHGKPMMGKILDGTAGQAVVTARAGMLAGLFSPSKPWMAVTTKDPTLAREEDVGRWLDRYTRAILETLGRSTFYDQLELCLGDELVYGTSALMIFEDPEKHVRFEAFPIGTYVLGQDSKGDIDSFGREYRMTLRQAAKEFGFDKLSQSSRQKLNLEGATETDIVVRHLILPNDDVSGVGLSILGAKWREFYWESGNEAGPGQVQQPTWGGAISARADGPMLRESGYHEFPVGVARWDRHAGLVWATRWPAALAIGDIKQLQAMEKAALNAANLGIKPALVGGPSTQNTDVSTMSDEITTVMETGDGMLKPLHVPNPLWMQFLEIKEEQTRQRIKAAFFEPVFQALMNDRRPSRPTAEEVRKIDRESASILGPILERHNALADIVIDRTSNILVRRSLPFWQQGEDGVLPVPPASMSGNDVELAVRYVSDVALSQKRNGLASLERFGEAVAGLAQIAPPTMDGVDFDKLLNHFAERGGVPEDVTRGDEERDAIRERRAEAEERARTAAEIPPIAGAAKDLSETQVNGRSALEALVGSP